MASDPLFDADEWQALTGPISETAPAGPDRFQDDKVRAAYYAINDARDLIIDAEKNIRRGQQSDVDLDPKWREIRKSAAAFLMRTGKDVNVAIYLTEALVRLHGFAGLRDGLKIVGILLDRFGDVWKTRLEPDEEPSTIIGLLTSAIGAGRGEALLRSPLLTLSLSDAATDQPATLAALIVSKDTSRPQSGASGPFRTATNIENDIRNASAVFLDDLRDDLSSAIDSVNALQQSLDRFTGGPGRGPSCAKLLDLVTQIRQTVVALVGEQRRVQSKPVTAADIATEKSGETEPGLARPVRPSYPSRSAAFAHLESIAAFFRTTSQQSLIAPAIETVIRRGQLGWQELVCELLPEEAARDSFLRAAGIKWLPGEPNDAGVLSSYSTRVSAMPSHATAADELTASRDNEIDAACATLIAMFGDDLPDCVDALIRLEASAESLREPAAPSASDTKLADLISRLLKTASARLSQMTSEPEASESPPPHETLYGRSLPESDGSPHLPAPQPVSSREEAFGQLQQVADYFREVDPQSPVSASIEDVVRRGRLPFRALIEELLPDAKLREAFLANVGIKWTQPPQAQS